MFYNLRGLLSTILLCIFLASCGGGGGETATPKAGANSAPIVSIVATGLQAPAAAPNVLSLSMTFGGSVSLDGSSSRDSDGDTLSYEWSIIKKPTNSVLVLETPTSPKLSFKPDVNDSYTLQLKVSDTRGGVGTQQILITTDNRVPLSAIATTVQFNAIPTNMPTQQITVGADVVLNAAGVTDPDGDEVSVTFELTDKPSGSAANLSFAGKTSRFIADVQGVFKVKVRGLDSKGGTFESIYSFQVQNRSPIATVITSATSSVNLTGDTTMTTSVGYGIVLDGTSSSDPDGQTLSHAWVMSSRPAGSSAALSGATGTSVSFTADVLGTYVISLTVTDAQGAQSKYVKRITANNRSPVANIGTSASPIAQPSAPNVLLKLGTEIILRGSLSSDADGDLISYLWSVDARPSGSTANLSSITIADPKFVADKEGSYIFRLRVTDATGAFSERTIGIDIGSHAPVAVLSRDRISTLVGSSISATADLSYDQDGDTLKYNWTIDAKPVGSSATIGTANTSELTFSPDLPGNYSIAVTVSDGNAASVAYLNVLVLPTLNSSVSLNFVPDRAKYSLGLDKLIVSATNPDTLRIVDPFVGSVRSVALPLPVKNFSLSPDGKLAGVLHEGIVSLVDLINGTIIKSTSTGGAQTDVFVMNSGVVFLIGQTGGQWVNESVVAIDARYGQKITQQSGYLGMFYGTQYGILADKLNKVFLMEQGLSPSDIDYFSFNPATSQAIKFGDSPYHGDYSMSVPLYLSENQSILFTSYGNYFRTDTLQYAGVLNGVTRPLSLSNSALNDETLVLQANASNSYPYTSTLPTSYMRFTGALFLPDNAMPLPLVGGTQSYGLKVFHSASGKHVILVQTNTNLVNGPGVRYAVITR